jgi:hypothetical protein
MFQCLRVADDHTRHILVEEFLIAPPEMEKLLRDHYANYVVQTAVSFQQRPKLAIYNTDPLSSNMVIAL